MRAFTEASDEGSLPAAVGYATHIRVATGRMSNERRRVDALQPHDPGGIAWMTASGESWRSGCASRRAYASVW